jgi:hypothetical protein
MDIMQKLVKFHSVSVLEKDGTKHFYIDFFSQHDFDMLNDVCYEITDTIELPLSHSDRIRESFRTLYSPYLSYSQQKNLPHKVAYNLEGDRFKRVRTWLNYYRGYCDEFLPE